MNAPLIGEVLLLSRSVIILHVRPTSISYHRVRVVYCAYTDNIMYTHHEHHLRSILKAISWKIVAAIITFVTTYLLTKDMGFAGEFTGIWTTIGLFAYYLHERVWNNIHWGRETREPCQKTNS